IYNGVGRGDVVREIGILKLECPGLVDLPRSRNFVRICQSDVFAAMIGKIEVVLSKRILDPRRDLDQAGTIDIGPDAWVGFRDYDRIACEAPCCPAGSRLTLVLRWPSWQGRNQGQARQ